MKLITTTLVFLALACGAGVCMATASGQKKSAQTTGSQRTSSSPTAQKERARRVVVTSPGEAAAASGDKPTASKIALPKENSATPTITNVSPDGSERTETRMSETPGHGSAEKVGGDSLPSAAESQENKTSPDSLTELRSEIEAAKNGPERLRFQLRLSEQLVAVGQKTEATKELRAILNNDVFDPQGYYNVGNALARLGYSDDAISAYRKAIDQRRGNYSRALNNLGVVLLREGRWDEAHEALLSALKVENFRYAEASYNLGRLYSARGENDIANREWRRALIIDPGHKAAAEALALGASQPGMVGPAASARSAKNRLTGAAPRNTPTSARLEKSAATPNFSTVKPLTLDPISYDFLQRARELSERGKLEGAVENYRRVLSRASGYFPPANLELSYALIALKRNDEALGNVLQVANRDGARFPIAYQLVARCYESQGNLELAEEWFAKAASAYKSKNNSFLLDLSRVRERRGNFKGALAALEEYVSAMEQQGLRPTWADESLAVLRRKTGSN